MSDPFIGELRMFAGNFAPVGWAFAEGQELPISENESLFVLYGTRYGGNGEETFRLPDLRGRAPMHTDSAANQGETAGITDVTLTTQQIPAHTHTTLASTDAGTLPDPGNHVLARSNTPGVFLYSESEAPDVTLNAATISPVGGSQPHSNVQPYLCVNFIVSLFGIFPSPT
jgi:microcystin-dependent protein